MLSNIFLMLVFLYLSAVLIGCLVVMFFILRGDTITIGRTDSLCQFTKSELTETDKKKPEPYSANTGK